MDGLYRDGQRGLAFFSFINSSASHSLGVSRSVALERECKGRDTSCCCSLFLFFFSCSPLHFFFFFHLFTPRLSPSSFSCQEVSHLPLCWLSGEAQPAVLKQRPMRSLIGEARTLTYEGFWIFFSFFVLLLLFLFLTHKHVLSLSVHALSVHAVDKMCTSVARRWWVGSRRQHGVFQLG